MEDDSEESSSQVCRQLGSGRRDLVHLGAYLGRGDTAGTAGAASAAGRTSGDAAGALDDAAGAGDGGACQAHHRPPYCWLKGLGLDLDVRKIRMDAFQGPVPLPDAADVTVVRRMPAKIHRHCRCRCHRAPPLEISLPFHHPLLNHFENSFHRNEYQYHFANYSSCLSVVDDGVRHRLDDDR